MSQENVEVILAAYEAIARRDREALDALLTEHLAPDFVFDAALTGATYRGAAGFWELVDDIEDTVGYRPEVQEAVDLGERVMIVLRMSGRGSRSGVPVAQEGALIVTFDGDTLASAKSYASKAEALEALGLRE
jgi:ketosteroid isomerase-like protein